MKKKIIVVTHEIDSSNTYFIKLEAAGYNIFHMIFMGDVHKLLCEENPDLIIIDNNIGTSNVENLVKQIRNSELNNISIIVINNDMIINEYLLGPVEPELMKVKVENLIGKSSNSSEIKIVLIDDEIELCNTLSSILEEWGYEVKTAQDGALGLELIKKTIPDIILLDVNLPELTGLEICKKVRMNESISFIPIIMITTKDQEIDKIIGKVLGANAYFTKPFNHDQLYLKIKELTMYDKINNK